MRESRLSGSEGGARFYSSLLPLSSVNELTHSSRRGTSRDEQRRFHRPALKSLGACGIRWLTGDLMTPENGGPRIVELA